MSLRSTCIAVAVSTLWISLGQPQAQSGVSAPVLMWQYGGCTTGPYCQTGWYASPVVGDIDSDGQPEVIWGSYDVVALNGSTGSLKWRAASTNRVWPGVAVADLTGDGTLEVVVARSSDELTVYDRFGGTLRTRSPFGSGEIRSLAVDDVEGDGQLEIIVGHAGSGSYQVNVLTASGATRTGWPARHAGEPGYGTGLWNQNVAVADMNGDGLKEIFAPTGGHYITALDYSGNQLFVNSIYAPRQYWSEVGVYVDHSVDLQGWANCGVDHRPTFADSAPVVADVNADGVPELIVVGNIYDCGTNPYTYLYHMPFIFTLDRTRWSGSGFDWTAIPAPSPGSAPRSQDWSVIETALPNPVVTDLDGDGFKEILFPSYDGKVHAYWLDKTEHGNWPYTIPTSGASGDDFRFASEPIVVDFNNDGRAEVIFTSWPKKATGRVGQLHILNYQGVEISRIDLPAPATGATWNGALGAPTIANLDSDLELELVVGTVASGVVAYKLPNTANARVLWGTGRGNDGRTGIPVTAALPPDTTPPTVGITSPLTGVTVSATITVSASASDNAGIAGVQFRLDGANLGAEDTTAPYAVAWDTTTSSNGSHTLTAVARDAAGNVTTSAPVTVTVSNADTTPPTVAITSSASGATVSATITVSASASDNVGIAGVQFRLDGANLGAEDTTAPYAVAWDTTTSSNGSHTLTAVARDAAGNIATSAPVTVTVSNADTTPPTVTITSPASGATVSGTITVSASASDNVAVAGVRFFVDSVAIGAEDTTAPYAVAWDTTVVTDGSHALTAVARDTAGNTTTSAGVAVTVANGAPAPTRFEERAATVAPADAWSEVRSAGIGVTLSGDRAVFASAASATATFGFTGTGVSWLGVRCEVCGIARVSLDGTLVATVDTFAPLPRSAGVMFSTGGLAASSHTLVIEVTGTANPSSSGAFIVVDAFDVTSDSTSSADAMPPTVAITSPASGATVSGTVTVTASASDNVAVAGVRFFVDGVAIGVEDTAPPYAVAWDTTTVANASHTLTAVARDTSGHTTTSAPVTVDVANGGSTATRFEESAATLTPPSDWFYPITEVNTRGAQLSGDVAAGASAAGARATFTFSGTGVSWIGLRCPECGIANVYIDGAQVATVDTFSPTWPASSEPMFRRTGLALGSHTLVIEATFMRNPSATEAFVIVDAFDVF